MNDLCFYQFIAHSYKFTEIVNTFTNCFFCELTLKNIRIMLGNFDVVLAIKLASTCEELKTDLG